MYRTKLFLDTGGIRNRERSGRPHVVRTLQVINAVRSTTNRNPVRKQKIMARKIDIVPRTMSHIIKQDFGLLNDKQDNALQLH